jgi:TrmH family RNA methyltransferase
MLTSRFEASATCVRRRKSMVRFYFLPPRVQLDRLCVVLVATRNPLNIGAAARAMRNFGCRDLRVVNPYDLAFREARSAVGAPELLANAQEHKTVAAAVADCTLVVGTTAGRNRDFQHPLRGLEAGALLARKHLRGTKRGRVALLFGSEKRGLSNTDLSHCNWLLHIPTREEHPSMNLGQAVAVCLYELVRKKRAVDKARAAAPQPVTSAKAELITTLLLDAVRASGYLKSQSRASATDKMRRMVRRLKLTETDAELWLGMLRQILWKLQAATKEP